MRCEHSHSALHSGPVHPPPCSRVSLRMSVLHDTRLQSVPEFLLWVSVIKTLLNAFVNEPIQGANYLVISVSWIVPRRCRLQCQGTVSSPHHSSWYRSYQRRHLRKPLPAAHDSKLQPYRVSEHRHKRVSIPLWYNTNSLGVKYIIPAIFK